MIAKEKPLSREKIAIVHIAAHQLRMQDADYRALLMQTAGVNSSRELNEAGFRAVMLRMEKLGFTHGKPKAATAPQYGQRDGMATLAQVATIRKLWANWHGQDDARALGHWLHRSFLVSDLRFVDVATAQKAIEGLKAMTRRKPRAIAPATPGTVGTS
jgi:phage gp16-like protein